MRICHGPALYDCPMNCRLCNEKIPRMRALFKKSEFCCDEHADQYKDQTLNRLLAEAEKPADSAAPLPLPQPSDLPLESLESRTPLLEGSTVQNRPRRLAPPMPDLPAPEQSSEFGGLLDRLPQRKSASPAAGNNGGWDEVGGEDPFEALMRLESTAPASPAGPGPARGALPSGFDPASGAAPSSEEDAISALRRLAEEARQTARPKPDAAANPGANAEDPFARLTTGDWATPKAPSGEDSWAMPAKLPSASGEADGEQGFDDRPFDNLEEDHVSSESATADGASMFDRLVRDFDRDTHYTPEDAPGLSAPQPRAESDTDPWQEPASGALTGDDDAPFSGSAFDRLMAAVPQPKPANTVESPLRASALQDSPSEQPVEPPAAGPTEVENETREAPTPAPAPAEMEAVKGASEDATFAEPTLPIRSKKRKAAPIVARTELSDIAPAGWPVGEAASIETGSIEQDFVAQRTAEAAQHATQSPALIQPFWINFPVGNAKPAARSGDFRSAGMMPWRPPVARAGAPPTVSPALESPRSESQPAAPPLRMPDPPRANGHFRGPSRSFWIEGHVMAIDPAPARDLLSDDTSRLPLECLRVNGRRVGPLPLPLRVAPESLYPVRLELDEVLPFAGPPVDTVTLHRSESALPPSWPVRLPGVEQNGGAAPTEAGVLPGAVAELVGTEPRGSSIEAADPRQMHRLIAEQTATAVGANGNDVSAWKPSIAHEPFQPVLQLENGHRP